MVTDPRQTVKEASARSWNWVKRKTFNPLPFYKRSWELLKQDPWVFAWKMLADLLGRAGNISLVMVLVALFSFDLQSFTALGGGFGRWVTRISEIAVSPAFIIGLTGAVFCVAIIGAALEALVTGGIWGMLAAGLRGEPIERLRTFWRAALLRFPDVFALFLLRFSVRFVTLCIAAALGIGLLNAMGSPEFAALGTFGKALIIALPVSFVVSWFALTRLVLEVIGAPMVIDDLGLGDAVLEGAAFVLENFWAMYRLFIFALGLLLVPLGLYWVVLMAQNFALTWPLLTPALTLLRFGAEILMWASISCLGVLFYGAVFAFYRKDDATVEEEERLSGAHAAVTGPGLSGRAASTGPGAFVEGVSLADLLPDEAPHRFPISELLPEHAPGSEDLTESEDGVGAPKEPAQLTDDRRADTSEHVEDSEAPKTSEASEVSESAPPLLDAQPPGQPERNVPDEPEDQDDARRSDGDFTPDN